MNGSENCQRAADFVLENPFRGEIVKRADIVQIQEKIGIVISEFERDRVSRDTGDIDAVSAVRVGQRFGVPVLFRSGNEPQRDRTVRELFHGVRAPLFAEGEDVVPAAVHPVVADAADDHVVAVRADDPVVSGIAEQQIVALVRPEAVAAVTAFDRQPVADVFEPLAGHIHDVVARAGEDLPDPEQSCHIFRHVLRGIGIYVVREQRISVLTIRQAQRIQVRRTEEQVLDPPFAALCVAVGSPGTV